MADSPSYRRDLRGRFTRVPVEAAYADQSRFPTVAKEGMDVEFQGADTGDLAYDAVPRYAPDGDTLAGAGPSYGSSPLRSRRPELVHADDEGFHNAVLRTAARRSVGRPDDPTAFLVGLESHGTLATGVRTVDDGR